MPGPWSGPHRQARQGRPVPIVERGGEADVVWPVRCRSHPRRIANPTRTDRPHRPECAGHGPVDRSDGTPDIQEDRLASATRRSVDDRLVLEAASHLTDRDRYICRLILEHQVLTTHQIRQVCFDSQRRTTLRLAQLHRLRILDRFRPLVPTGSAPHHWILDTVGATIVAAERGTDVAELGWRRDKAARVATSPQLGHLVGVNGFFCSLLETARHQPDTELVLWWSARRCAARWGQIVRPDGYGVWEQDRKRVAFLLEYDNGTERVARLAEKLQRYRQLFDRADQRVWLLFCFPGPAREAGARQLLHLPGISVATTHGRTGGPFAGSVWLPVQEHDGPDRTRVRLVDLGPVPNRSVG